MSEVGLSDEAEREFVVEFGEDAPQVAEGTAQRDHPAPHRGGAKDGTDPAAAGAEALAKAPEFAAEVERIGAASEQRGGNLEERHRHSAGDLPSDPTRGLP